MSPLNIAKFFVSILSKKLHFGSFPMKQFAITNLILLPAKSKAHLKLGAVSGSAFKFCISYST